MAKVQYRSNTEASLEKKGLYIAAKNLYLEQAGKPAAERLGSSTVCNLIAEVHFKMTGRCMTLGKSTLMDHVNGKHTTWEYHDRVLLVSTGKAHVLID